MDVGSKVKAPLLYGGVRELLIWHAQIVVYFFLSFLCLELMPGHINFVGVVSIVDVSIAEYYL